MSDCVLFFILILIHLHLLAAHQLLCDSVVRVVCNETDHPPRSMQHADRMCFQIQRVTGLWYSAEYSSFSLGPESDKYRLNVAGYSGDAGDAIAAAVGIGNINNGWPFSSADQDNDNHPTAQCGNGKSGWWFKWCSRSYLTKDGPTVWNAATKYMVNDVVFARMLVKLD